MKKYYLLASAILALTISACSPSVKPSEKPSEEESQQPSQPSEHVETPAVEPTVEVAFEKIDDTVGVPSYVQQYVDAMHEQEGTITYPHRVDKLYCNMSWEEAASQADKGDGTKYDDDHSGGVDVCQMLSRTQKYECKPIEIKWDKGDEDYSGAKLVFWSKEDKSDKREVAVEADGASAKLPNLFRNTKYYYQLVNGDDASQMKNFVTADYPRMITMGDISNVRDMGGYQSSYGGTLNQGLIYRGGEMAVEAFTDGSNRHSKNWTDAAQVVQKEVLNIGLELDLRTKSGSGNMVQSPLEYDGEGNSDGRAEYKRCSINSYDKFITDPNRASEADNAGRNLVKEIFETLSNADKQHVYFHCWGGADRTGVTGFLLLGICGVSYTDAIIDFELTTLTNNKRCHMHNSSSAHMPKFLNLFVTEYTFERDGQQYKYEFDEEKTLRYNAENLLLAMGVEQATIEKIRTIMIPGYQTGVSEENEMVNKGWQ